MLFSEGREWLTTLEPGSLCCLTATLAGVPPAKREPGIVYLGKFDRVDSPPYRTCIIGARALPEHSGRLRLGAEVHYKYPIEGVPQNSGFCFLFDEGVDDKPPDRLAAVRLGEVFGLLLENANNRPTAFALFGRVRAYRSTWVGPRTCSRMYGFIHHAMGDVFRQ